MRSLAPLLLLHRRHTGSAWPGGCHFIEMLSRQQRTGHGWLGASRPADAGNCATSAAEPAARAVAALYAAVSPAVIPGAVTPRIPLRAGERATRFARGTRAARPAERRAIAPAVRAGPTGGSVYCGSRTWGAHRDASEDAECRGGGSSEERPPIGPACDPGKDILVDSLRLHVPVTSEE
jgi:hypothetical protein